VTFGDQNPLRVSRTGELSYHVACGKYAKSIGVMSRHGGTVDLQPKPTGANLVSGQLALAEPHWLARPAIDRTLFISQRPVSSQT
jgi:hypothetical protein